jgi:TPR repeat protein
MRTTIHFDDLLAQYVHLADHNDEDFRRAMLQLNRAKTTDELNQALKGLVKVAHTYPYGYAFLASLYFEGTMVERNDKKAFYYLQKGIKANDPTCIFRFGTELLSESFNKRSIKRAYAFIGKAASMDLPIAYDDVRVFNLGFEDVKPNYPLAFSTFQRLADLNHGEGYAVLGMMHENGMGTPASGVEAVRNYLKSCSLENPMGHLFFGRFFLSGQFYPRNAEAAAGHLRWGRPSMAIWKPLMNYSNLYLSETKRQAWLQDAKTIIDELHATRTSHWYLLLCKSHLSTAHLSTANHKKNHSL